MVRVSKKWAADSQLHPMLPRLSVCQKLPASFSDLTYSTCTYTFSMFNVYSGENTYTLYSQELGELLKSCSVSQCGAL